MKQSITESLVAIDASIAALTKQEASMRAAIARANASGVAAIATSADSTAKRRSLLADIYLGITGKRAELDKLKAQVADAEQQREASLQARADADVAVIELQRRLEPIYAQKADLARERIQLVRQGVRERAEQAARDYEDAAVSLGVAYARLCAHGQELRRLDDAAGGVPLAFAGDNPQAFNVPAPDIGVLAGNFSRLSVVFHPMHVQTHREVFVDFETVKRDVIAEIM